VQCEDGQSHGDEERKEGSGLEEDLDGDMQSSKVKEESKKSAREISEKMAGKDIESSGEDSDGADDKQGLFINPLAVKAGGAKNGDDDEEEWSDDDSVDPKDAKGKKKKDKSLLGKRKRKGDVDGA
jgi:hypothetical protein